MGKLKSLKFDPVSRRTFLLGLGGFGLSLPFLPSLIPRAFAQESPQDWVRMVQLFHLYGRPKEGTLQVPVWFPAQSPRNRIEKNVYAQLLSEIPNPMSYILGNHFAPVKSKMNIIRGLDYLAETVGHNACGPTTASTNFLDYMSGDPENRLDTCVYPYSIDAILAESNKVYPAAMGGVTQKALRLYPGNVDPQVGQARSFSWRSVDGTANRSERLYGQWNARVVFDQLFGNGGGSESTPVESQRRQLASDLVLEQFNSVMKSTRISTEDKAKLGNYMDLVHELQKRINTTNVCQDPELENFTETSPAEVAYRNHTDLIVAAMLCGKTRIAQMMIHHADSGARPPADYHNSAHFDVPKFTDYLLWKSKRVAELLIAMDAHQEANGKTLLDNSIVYWSSDHAISASHGPQSIPVITAGTAAGHRWPRRSRRRVRRPANRKSPPTRSHLQV